MNNLHSTKPLTEYNDWIGTDVGCTHPNKISDSFYIIPRLFNGMLYAFYNIIAFLKSRNRYLVLSKLGTVSKNILDKFNLQRSAHVSKRNYYYAL